MKSISCALLLMLCTIWFGAACAEEIIYCGSAFPYFHVTKDNRMFCTAYENYGNVFRSKNTLYSVDLNEMRVQKIFSVRNAYSKIFVYNNTVYFTYPDSWFSSNLIYGDHRWYSSNIKSAAKKANWNLLCENNTKSEERTVYFDTIDGVYRYVSSKEDYGRCELYRFDGEQYTQTLIIDNARIAYGYTYVIIEMQNQSERNSLKVYDIQGARMLDIPYTNGWLPEIVISADKLYYTTENEVVCYNINTSTTSVVYNSGHDKYMSLCCDGMNLFIIENMADRNGRVTTMKLSDNQCMFSTIIPAEYFRGGINNIIVNGIVLSGSESLDGLYAYSIMDEKGYFIPFQKQYVEDDPKVDRRCRYSNDTLEAHVLRGNREITAERPAGVFSWTRVSGDTAADTAWNASHAGMKQIALSASDMAAGVQIACSYSETMGSYGTVQVDEALMASHTPATADASDVFALVDGDLVVTTASENGTDYALNNGRLTVNNGFTGTISATAAFSSGEQDADVENIFGLHFENAAHAESQTLLRIVAANENTALEAHVVRGGREITAEYPAEPI